MKTIVPNELQRQLSELAHSDVYFHLETSTGSYAAHEDSSRMTTCAFIRNGTVCFTDGQVRGDGPAYRVGLRLDNGWLYAEGLTDWELDSDGKLLMGGYDSSGRQNIGLELSRTPFEVTV